MKIAVLNTNGIQGSIEGKKQFYYSVVDDYDFSGNTATDVTDIDTLTLFYKLLRIDYCQYRDSLLTLYPTITYSGETAENKKILCKNFIVDKSERDVYFNDEEQTENAVEIQELIKVCEMKSNLENKASDIVNSNNTDISMVGELSNYRELHGDVEATVTGLWHKITLPDTVTPNSIIMVSCRSTKNKIYGGVREVGSTFDRRKPIALESSFTLLVKVDNNRQIEVYAQTADVNFYINAQLS